MNWSRIDKVVEILAFLFAGGFMIYGVETDNLRWFAFGVLGILLLMKRGKTNEK